jgi:mRNA-degrading endonuclease toxin of MazEF toxin-antitoxin module
VQSAQEGPLHIKLNDSSVQGVVLCEQVRYLDLAARRFHKLTATHYFDIMDISDAVVSMIEYQ